MTQLLWKGSTELGVGVAVVDGTTAYVVGNYNPPGNMVGDFNRNVPGPKDGKFAPLL